MTTLPMLAGLPNDDGATHHPDQSVRGVPREAIERPISERFDEQVRLHGDHAAVKHADPTLT